MFHDRLRATRITRGYTLQKTADALDIPLRTYQNYEAGVRQKTSWQNARRDAT